MGWRKPDPLGPTDATRREWKNIKSEQDKRAAASYAQEPERGEGEISRGHYNTLMDIVHKLGNEGFFSGSRVRTSRSRPLPDDVLRRLDALIDSLDAIPDEPQGYQVQGSGWFGNRNQYEEVAQAFFDRYAFGSDPKSMYRDAAYEYHPDARPELSDHDREFNGRVFSAIHRTLNG